MSNSWWNVRFGSIHFQWDKGRLLPRLTRNLYHEQSDVRGAPGWAWFEIYETPWRS